MLKNVNLMFIGPCIIALVEEWKTNSMSLAILFHLLCAQHVSDINISIFRSLRLSWWITTLVVLFSVRCVLELLVRLVFGGVRFAGFREMCFSSRSVGRCDREICCNSMAVGWIDWEMCFSSRSVGRSDREICCNSRSVGRSDRWNCGREIVR